VAEKCAKQWRLELEEPFDTPHSLVVPAGDAVLKLNAPSHFEADHEAEALARWGGDGAVRLIAHDEERRALLIERCRPGMPLWDTDEDDVAVVAELLPRLWNEPEDPHPFRRLAHEAERWLVDVPQRYDAAGEPFDRRLLELACDVFRSADSRAVALVNQDLHGGNVLRAERTPWLVIDPKPLVGEREANGVGLLRNAAVDGGVDAVRRWLDALAQLGLDRDRTLGWGAAHALAWGWDEKQGWWERSIEAARLIASA